jgi:hypothetical protein
LCASFMVVREWRSYPMRFMLDMSVWQLIFNGSLLACFRIDHTHDLLAYVVANVARLHLRAWVLPLLQYYLYDHTTALPL